MEPVIEQRSNMVARFGLVSNETTTTKNNNNNSDLEHLDVVDVHRLLLETLARGNVEVACHLVDLHARARVCAHRLKNKTKKKNRATIAPPFVAKANKRTFKWPLRLQPAMQCRNGQGHWREGAAQTSKQKHKNKNKNNKTGMSTHRATPPPFTATSHPFSSPPHPTPCIAHPYLHQPARGASR